MTARCQLHRGSPLQDARVGLGNDVESFHARVDARPYDPDALHPLITADAIQRVPELANEIGATTPATTPDLICVLKGAFVFLADLVRAMPGA